MPENRNRVPSGLGLRPARMHKVVFFSVFFPFWSLLPLLFCPLFALFALLCITVLSSPHFRVYAYTTAMFLVVSRIKRYGIVYYISL